MVGIMFSVHDFCPFTSPWCHFGHEKNDYFDLICHKENISEATKQEILELNGQWSWAPPWNAYLRFPLGFLAFPSTLMCAKERVAHKRRRVFYFCSQNLFMFAFFFAVPLGHPKVGMQGGGLKFFARFDLVSAILVIEKLYFLANLTKFWGLRPTETASQRGKRANLRFITLVPTVDFCSDIRKASTQWVWASRNSHWSRGESEKSKRKPKVGI